MRSRPPRPCAPPSALHSLARLIDTTAREQPGHLLIHVIEDDGDLLVGTRALSIDTHPFSELAGFTAPLDWAMAGVRVRGTAHHLDDDHAPEHSATTYLVHRSGEERSILRCADTVTDLPGPASGTLPDLCRRVLGMPTHPAPSSTVALWTIAWLDRLVERWGDPAFRRALTASWSAVAGLHPAVTAGGGRARAELSEDPEQLVPLARAHAAAWPWHRLRAAPHALPLPDGVLPRWITEWMDDGFYARWAFGAFPPAGELAHDITPLLDPHVGATLLRTLERLAA